MNWSTEPQPKPLSAETQRLLKEHGGSADQLIMAWQNAARLIEDTRRIEIALRTAIIELKFGDLPEGTNRCDLGNGYALKAIGRMNYNFVKAPKETGVEPWRLVEQCIDDLAKAGNEGSFIADRLIKWLPELSVKEYRELAPHYRAIVDKVLVVKPGTPQLEFEQPKEK